MKKCYKCGLIKPFTEYHRHRTRADGLRSECKECMRIYNVRYHKKNKKYFRDYERRRYRTDPVHRMRCLIRKNSRRLLFGRYKHSDLIGSDHLTFRRHIEKQFQPGMVFDNYGRWELDHITPLGSVTIETPDWEFELRRLANYQNVRPLWVTDNQKRNAGVQIPDGDQYLLFENHKPLIKKAG
jgi:hypothetical protein